MIKYSRYLCLPVLLAFFSCTSNEIGNSKDVNPDAIFFDYVVKANQDHDYVTINLQYRMGGPNGTTLVLEDPSKVMFDDEVVEVDSAGLMGAYYETHRPMNEFAGKHIITFIDYNNKEYKEEFEFTPFTLNPEIGPVMERGDLEFRFKGLDPDDRLGVVLMDTSFSSRDINDVDPVHNGKLVISAERLAALRDGPITLLFYKEKDIPVQNGTAEGGLLKITYELNRSFELKSSASPQ